MSPGVGSAQIVRLTGGNAGPCLLLVPGTGGKIDGFVSLAPYLRIPIPAFAIEARGLDEASVPDIRVEDMAQHYLARIQAVQATAPYFLLGHSFGGLVALEMAQRLRAADENVACLIMLDTPTPEKYWPFLFYLKSRMAKLRRQAARLWQTPLLESLKHYRRSLASRHVDLRQMPADMMINGNVARVLLAHGVAREGYRLTFYNHKITFFRPLEQPEGYEKLWHHRARELEILPAPGGHLSMIEPPHAALLGAAISECVRQALAATSSGPLQPAKPATATLSHRCEGD